MKSLVIFGFLWFIYDFGSVNSAFEKFTVIDFLHNVKQFHGFDYLLFIRRQKTTEISSVFQTNSTEFEWHLLVEMMSVLKIPVIQLNEQVNYTLNKIFNSDFFSLVYIDGTVDQQNDLLKALAANLYSMPLSRVLFLINITVNEKLLHKLFAFCWQQRLLNVAALFSDYQETDTFYSYTPFPVFSIEYRKIGVNVLQQRPFYPERLHNMNGYRLPIIYGGSEPRIIAYKGNNGQIVYGGAVGHFLRAFSQKYNCVLYEPLPSKLNGFAPAIELIQAVRNQTVEISAGITYPPLRMDGLTYPFELTNWCLMTPIEADVPAFQFYTLVFELQAFLLTILIMVLISMALSFALSTYGYNVNLVDFIIHDNCLRGLLGQSFLEVFQAPSLIRVIYFYICVLGILLTTIYNSTFSAYVTRAPKQPPLVSFEDIMYSTLSVIVWKPEYSEMMKLTPFLRKYDGIFKIEPDYKKYLSLRDSFNTKFIYVIPSSKWSIINEQQKVFTKRLFNFRKDLCFYNNVPLGFPVRNNSIYIEALNKLILEAAATGLTAHWLQSGFIEMIEARKLTFADLSPIDEFRAMQMDDLKYVWWGYSFLIVFSLLIFMCEKFWYRRKQNLLCCWPNHIKL